MKEIENKIFIASAIFSFIIHLILVNYLPGIKFDSIDNEKKDDVIRISTNFVKIKKAPVNNNIVSSKAPEKKKVTTQEEGKTNRKIEIETKTPIGEVDRSNDFLPDVKTPEIAINKDNFTREIIVPQRTKETIEFENRIEKEDFTGIDFEISKKSYEEEDNEIAKIPIKIEDEKAVESDIIIPVIDEKFQESGITPIELPDGVSTPKVIGKNGEAFFERYVDPVYPAEAEKNGWRGSVTLRLTVNEDGNVELSSVFKKSGYTVIDSSAKAASKNWKIKIVDNGIAITGVVQVTINFKL